MPKPVQAQESFSDITFPVNGIDVSTAYSQQRQGTTPVGSNVRAFEPSTNRARGASRPGLAKYVSGQVNGTNSIQELQYVIQPSGQIAGSATATGAVAIYYLTPDPNPTVLHRSNGTTDQWTYTHQNSCNSIAGYQDTVGQVTSTYPTAQIITAGTLTTSLNLSAMHNAANSAVKVAAGNGYIYFVSYKTGPYQGVYAYAVGTGATSSAAINPTWAIDGSDLGLNKVMVGTGAGYTDRLFTGWFATGLTQVKIPALDASISPFILLTPAQIATQAGGAYLWRGDFGMAGSILGIAVQNRNTNTLCGMVFYNLDTSAFVYTPQLGIAMSGAASDHPTIESDGTNFYMGVPTSSGHAKVYKISGTDGSILWTSATFTIPGTEVSLGYVA